MTYKDHLRDEMNRLSQDPHVVFLGQQVATQDFYGTLCDIPIVRRGCRVRIEMPVAEELQMGISIGLAINGFTPVSIYQRIDFLPRAMDQIVNHLDIIREMSNCQYVPKVIIRTTIGSKEPLNTGLQHSKDMIKGFQAMVSFPIFDLKTPNDIIEGYNFAKATTGPVMLVERQDLYNKTWDEAEYFKKLRLERIKNEGTDNMSNTRQSRAI